MASTTALTDIQKACIYFEAPGKTHVRTSNTTGSLANIKYANLVMTLVEGPLRTIWGDQMSQNVAIVVPYSRQHELYETKMQDLRGKGWSDASLPQVWTVDQAAGREATHVILDEVNCMGGQDDLGFVRKDGRAVTFYTRAREATWTVGGKPSEEQAADVGRTACRTLPSSPTTTTRSAMTA